MWDVLVLHFIFVSCGLSEHSFPAMKLVLVCHVATVLALWLLLSYDIARFLLVDQGFCSRNKVGRLSLVTIVGEIIPQFS